MTWSSSIGRIGSSLSEAGGWRSSRMRCLCGLLMVLPLLLQAQRYDPLHSPNTYRNADNPYYWKNRPPYEGYWQQDVHYRIKARMDEGADVVDAELTLTYW